MAEIRDFAAHAARFADRWELIDHMNLDHEMYDSMAMAWSLMDDEAIQAEHAAQHGVEL